MPTRFNSAYQKQISDTAVDNDMSEFLDLAEQTGNSTQEETAKYRPEMAEVPADDPYKGIFQGVEQGYNDKFEADTAQHVIDKEAWEQSPERAEYKELKLVKYMDMKKAEAEAVFFAKNPGATSNTTGYTAAINESQHEAFREAFGPEKPKKMEDFKTMLIDSVDKYMEGWNEANPDASQWEVERATLKAVKGIAASRAKRVAAEYEDKRKQKKLDKAAKAKAKEDAKFLNQIGRFAVELPEQLVGGMYDALNNTMEAARSVGKAIGVPNYALQYKNKKGEIEFKFLNEEEVREQGGLDKILPEFEGASTTGGEMVRALTTFASGFIPVSKGLGAAGMVAGMTKGMVAGGVADAIVTDPHQVRLSAMLNEVPALGAIIPDYMADNNPDNEAEWEGRMKNVIEGAVLGGMSELAIRGAIKMFKGYKVAAKVRASEAAKPPKPTPAPAKPAAKPAAKPKAGKAAPPKPEPVAPEMAPVKEAVDEVDDVAEQMLLAQEEFIQPTPINLGPKELIGETKGKVFINTRRIDTEADVMKVMQNVADKSYDTLSKGGKTLEGIQKASASEMKNVNDLLGRPTTRPFTAEEAVAARDILTTSAENLTGLGKLASSPAASPADLFEFRKALAVHNDIQTKVFAGRKATAQSLASWRITSKSSEGRAKAIQSLLANGSQDTYKMAKAISSVAEAGGNVSEVAAKLTSQTWKDAHYQVWINGLLSSPTTHAVNAMSNMGTTVMSIPERYITAGFEKMMGANGSAFIEANARATGFLAGMKDGFSLMAGHTKNEGLTISSKIENKTHAISATAWGKQPDSTIGKGLDYIGKAVNLPGWALEKGDNFFKGMNYRMMLNEKAAKQAFEEGLTGKEFAARAADLVQNPTEAMKDVGVDFARYQTFTNEAGDMAKAAQGLVKATPMGRYIMPFIRTPANILNYGFERTPLAPLMSGVREAISKGGSSAAEAYARMAGGSLLMAGVSTATIAGNITGSGPSNWNERRALEETGWQPYSVKMGDKYYSYERLEPIGSLAAYSADVTSILGQLNEEEGDSLVAASLAAFSKNLTNKTFLSGMTQFIDVVNSASPKKWEKYSQKMLAGMVQPVGSSVVKKVNNYFDDVKRDYTPDDTNGYLKSTFMLAAENIPGMGRSAPPLRDVWGEVQHYSNGVAPALDVISPIKVGKDKKDPVNNMIADNRIAMTLPEREINGVKLTNKEYDKYTELAGTRARETMVDAHERGFFDGMTGGPGGEIESSTKMILRKSRQWAKGEMMMESPDLEDRVYANKLEMEKKMTGEN